MYVAFSKHVLFYLPFVSSVSRCRRWILSVVTMDEIVPTCNLMLIGWREDSVHSLN